MAKKAIFKITTAANLNFKNFSFRSRECHQVSSKSDDFLLRYGDLTIFKMAAVRHLGF